MQYARLDRTKGFGVMICGVDVCWPDSTILGQRFSTKVAEVVTVPTQSEALLRASCANEYMGLRELIDFRRFLAIYGT